MTPLAWTLIGGAILLTVAFPVVLVAVARRMGPTAVGRGLPRRATEDTTADTPTGGTRP